MFNDFFGNSNSPSFPSSWSNLTSIEQAEQAIASSDNKPVLFFKHSTRCPISTMAQRRIEVGSEQLAPKMNIQYLDLIAFRNVSNWLADSLHVTHQSPQVILVKNKEVIHISTHNEINSAEILEALAS